MSSQVNGNINKQRRRRRQSTTNDTPKPTTIQNQSLSKYDDQRSPDCHLIRAFVAQPIMGYTWGTPASHYLLRKQRQNRHANHKGRGLDLDTLAFQTPVTVGTSLSAHVYQSSLRSAMLCGKS